MAKRLVIDPITRIEGHLRVEVEIKNGIVTDAYSSGTMVRLMEEIVKGRDPRDVWAFAGRVCGVCTTVHSLASVRSVENALGIVIPPNAELVRNIMFTSQYLQDHVVHFYQLHALDWVDIVASLNADPEQTSLVARSISPWPKSSPGYFKAVQDRIKKFVESGQLGIFANGYWGHKQYKLTPEVNLLAVAHYLEALDWQKEIVKVHAIFGGKNPHPNYLVGGMAAPINMNEPGTINMERLNFVHQVLKDAKTFVDQVYIPDVLAIAPSYLDWASIGGGLHNYMSFGDLPTNGINDPDSFKFPAGAILGRDLSKVHPVNPQDESEIQEFIKHSWYSYEGGDDVGLHPYKGESKLNFTGPEPPYDHLNVDEKYSWVKTPRWKGHAMEVGPLARMLVGYALKRDEFVDIIDSSLAKLNAPVEALFSTLGRTAARAFESALVANWGLEFFDQLITNIKLGDTRMANTEKWEPSSWPKEAKGIGFSEAPRGALGHWIVIKDKKVDNYQMVVPSTWNSSPRDHKGQRSSYEESLVGTPVADPSKPIEVLRTIHSFDPCMACAVHLYDEKGEYRHQLEIF
jgi:hydrogenase large subunit